MECIPPKESIKTRTMDVPVTGSLDYITDATVLEVIDRRVDPTFMRRLAENGNVVTPRMQSLREQVLNYRSLGWHMHRKPWTPAHDAAVLQIEKALNQKLPQW